MNSTQEQLDLIELEETKPKPQSPLTLSGMVESLTGYDELAVEKHFTDPISDLMSTKPSMGIRALVFVDKTRSGLGPVDAKKHAMTLSMKEALGYFTPDLEVMPEEPITEEGKEPSGYGSEQESWLPSAS